MCCGAVGGLGFVYGLLIHGIWCRWVGVNMCSVGGVRIGLHGSMEFRGWSAFLVGGQKRERGRLFDEYDCKKCC